MLLLIILVIDKQFSRYKTVAVSITKLIDRPILKRVLVPVSDSLTCVFVYRSSFSDFLQITSFLQQLTVRPTDVCLAL